MKLMAPVLVSALLIVSVLSKPLTCADHPAYFPSLNPVLLSSWTILEGRKTTDAVYYPRYTTHRFAPVSNASSMIYSGLDWFVPSNYKQPTTENFIQLNLHRDAEVFLIIGVRYSRKHPSLALPGWKSEGWVTRVDGLDNQFMYGVHQKSSKHLRKNAYIFSKSAKGSATLPSSNWIGRRISGAKTSGGWYAMIGEKNGKPSTTPKPPSTVENDILPNQRCPDSLHRLWVTPETDASDPDVSGKMWPTWHPQWDPCYWCAYDHEHGSSPLSLMNYSPKFGYTPWKNYREDESHEGFKCTVFRDRELYVCFCIHAQTSSLRRVRVRTHTIIFAVSDASTKELLAEVTHKGFFGFTGTRKRGGGFLGLTEKEENTRLELSANGGATNKRSVNVINVKSLNHAYAYNEDAVLRGRYEEWTTNPICSGRGRHGMLNLDFRNPITAIVSTRNIHQSVNLGREKDGILTRNDGSSRILRFRDFAFGQDHCDFPQFDIYGGRSTGGTFYTDPSGTVLMNGPGKTNVRQFVKLGFKMEMSGYHQYDVVDPWGGELIFDTDAGRSSDGYGLDPDVN